MEEKEYIEKRFASELYNQNHKKLVKINKSMFIYRKKVLGMPLHSSPTCSLPAAALLSLLRCHPNVPSSWGRPRPLVMCPWCATEVFGA